PYTLTGLTNGVQYAFAVNARKGSGPGGPATPSVAVTPRAAGSVWTLLSPVGSANLYAGTYGLLSSTLGYRMVVAGDGGVVQTSTDGQTWTSSSMGGAVAVRGLTFAYGKLLVVGDEGWLASSSDLISFSRISSGVGTPLYSIASNGSKALVVGAGGVILASSDGNTWSRISSGTTQDLLAVTYSAAGYWIAVGAGGTVIRSSDGDTWTSVTSGVSGTLRSVAPMALTTTANNVITTNYRVVAAGDSGQLISSNDGLSWQLTVLPGQPNLHRLISVTRQMVAVGAAGTVALSADGLQWSQSPSVTSADLWAVLRFGNVYRAFGAGGTQLESR
ncbi:MAG: WD40/YVTN/BNR-like repeat-containing protein, partial [Limnohabitans sp.]